MWYGKIDALKALTQGSSLRYSTVKLERKVVKTKTVSEDAHIFERLTGREQNDW